MVSDAHSDVSTFVYGLWYFCLY